ncbi:Pleckstrin y domaincontaining A member 5 [Blomia tropicalis]|nr:Pleckstrin y domaincontaining A member 5 [Blomia tropicalis]
MESTWVSSHFESGELYCSSLIDKYITNRHLQNGQHHHHQFQFNNLSSSNVPNVDCFDSSSFYYPPRSTSFAPYYYGDLGYPPRRRRRRTGPTITNSAADSGVPQVLAIMDGLRVQLKNQSGRSKRSPNVNRSEEFTVSLRGWLYRLEGAALKQWKRRWCVLADYCLFYYKDMGEEKMLGSLLLPSYRISPCFSSDGISRKYSFKAEHSNMKTYYFAGDSKEIQQQWMNALSLASIMQLSIICPNIGKNGKTTNGNQPLSSNNKEMIGNTNNGEDESGFLEYQAKRIDNSSAIMYGSREAATATDYYDANYIASSQQQQQQQSLNLYNSVGLPSVYHHPHPHHQTQSIPYSSYTTAPPKPLRQYDPLTYDLPASNPITAIPNSQSFNRPDLLQAASTNNPFYFTNPYDPYHHHHQQQQMIRNHQMQYPDFIDPNEFLNPNVDLNFYSRLPPRPHSADFLERNQDEYDDEDGEALTGEDLDEECQNAFDKDSNMNNRNAKSLFTTNGGNNNNIAPNIMPTRPKSSIARYNPSVFMRDSQPIVTTSMKGATNLSQFLVYDNEPIISNNMGSQILSNYCSNKTETDPVPVRPPLPNEYKYNGNEPKVVNGNSSNHDKLMNKLNGHEASYTSDDENGSNKNGHVKLLDGPSFQTNSYETTFSSTLPQQTDLVEISKEEYFKASQMFYQRQHSTTGSTFNNSNSDLSMDSSTLRSLNSGDWNNVGLPIPNNSPSQQQQQQSPVKMIDGSTTFALNKVTETNSVQMANMNSTDNEVRFKLGGQVRTYKKPKNRDKDRYSSTDMTSDNSSTCSSAMMSSIPTINSEQTAKTSGSNISSAPYYVSDLLTEEQKIALQKKLGNFASPPPLSSRCMTSSHSRMTKLPSLKSTNKTCESITQTKTSTNEAVNSDCLIEKVENGLNEMKEMCQNKDQDKVSSNNKNLKTKSEEQLVNNKTIVFSNNTLSSSTSLEPNPIYQNYDSSPSTSGDIPTNSNNQKLHDKNENKIGKKCFDDYFYSLEEFNSKASLRKRRVKRRSKDDISKTADYIGKSHEELILMLIKLRRRQSELSKSCEQLRIQMESEAKMMEFEPHKKDEYNYRVKELKQKLSKVEQEYECQLPMINSIDSMIKIKSGGLHQPNGITSLISSSNESPKHLPISSPTKSIDTGIDMIKVISSPSDQSISTPSDNIENLKHQQKALANELDRVRGLLTHSTKKLEEKAVENAQMEQEMLVARNKLKQVLETEQEAMEISRSSKLESELAHINRVIDDLHSRRKELNTAIENLKNNSNDSNGYSDSYRSTQTKSSIQQYREAILSSSNIVPPPPLYENLSTRSYNEDQDESSSNGSRVQLFDQVNNNNNNRKDNDNENDEFFTLNINLNKAKYQMKQPNTNTTTTELNGIDCSEINNNDSNNFNLNSTSSTNSMCEFDPTKDLQQMMMTYGDSIATILTDGLDELSQHRSITNPFMMTPDIVQSTIKYVDDYNYEREA